MPMTINHIAFKLSHRGINVHILMPYNECPLECMTLYVNGAQIPFSLNLATFHLN